VCGESSKGSEEKGKADAELLYCPKIFSQKIDFFPKTP
jgi:hypothetical protein